MGQKPVRTKPPKKKKTNGGKPPLAKVIYKRMFDTVAENICKQFGGSTKHLKECFGIDEIELKNWRDNHPSFNRAVLRGRDWFDTERIERALAERATGYTFIEKEFAFVRRYDENGKPTAEVIKVPKKEITKHLPGSVDAQKYWLKMRNPKRWDTQKEKLDKDDNSSINEQILSQLSDRLPG